MASTGDHEQRPSALIPRERRTALAPRSQTTNLADLLERVLDKGIVIAGDITVSIGEVELLSIKLRLLVASIDKAQEIGIDWWRTDPALSSQARKHQLVEENRELRARLDRLEAQMSEKAVLAQPAERLPERGPKH
jgi:hypothetical protein